MSAQLAIFIEGKLAAAGMFEPTSGQGTKFALALAEAIDEHIDLKVTAIVNAHTHICAAPGSPSALPLPIIIKGV